MTNFITKTVEYVFIILLAIILLAMSIAAAELVFSGTVALVAGLMILAFVFAFLIIFREKIKKIFNIIKDFLSKIPSWQLALFLGLFSAVTKIALVFLFDNNADLHPDMAMYRSFAEQYANSGQITENVEYAHTYKYTVMYGLVLSPVAKLFGGDTKVFTVLLSVLHSVAMVLLYDILKRYTGKEIAFSALLLYCVTPMGLLQTQLLIHENGLLFFHILGLWIFLKAFDSKNGLIKQICYVVLASAVISVGKSINAAGRVIILSFAIYAVSKIFEKGFNLKRLTKAVCVCLCLLVFYMGASTLTNVVVENTVASVEKTQNEYTKMPYGWALYLGFNYEHSGLWNSEDRKTYDLYKEFATDSEAYEYQEKLVSDRLGEYVSSPIKIPIHFFNKIKVLWGTQLSPFGYELGNSVNSFVIHGYGGIINKLLLLLNRAVFLVVYSMIFISRIKALKNKTISVTPALHCKMAIIGVTAALLLFEVTPKYASHLHIMLFSIFAFGITTFFSKKIKDKKDKAMV